MRGTGRFSLLWEENEYDKGRNKQVALELKELSIVFVGDKCVDFVDRYVAVVPMRINS
jgi:hypothetical protein